MERIMANLLKPRSNSNPEVISIETEQKEARASIQRKPGVLKKKNFLLLWTGQGTSLLGDQFFLVAMPWLVLKLTGDPVTLGTVLALIGIPRALFMLLGGVVTDRYSPRVIMLASDTIRLGLTSLLGCLILFGWLELWALYLLAVGFGTISGFFIPASNAIMPSIVDSDELTVANSIYQGTIQLSLFVGPMLAGGLIGLFEQTKEASPSTQSPDITGIAIALFIDAFTFGVSIVTLLGIRLAKLSTAAQQQKPGLLTSIKEGIEYIWNQTLLRTVFILLIAANFLLQGPMYVGIPVLADTRYPEGAAAYGIVIGAYGGGNLLGIFLASSVIRALGNRIGLFFVGVITVFGIGLVLLGMVNSTLFAFIILFFMGAGNGVWGITGVTFFQRQTPQNLLGRMMSLILLATLGLAPISQALTGALIKLSLFWLFEGAGVFMVLVALWLALQPVTRTFGQVLKTSA